MKRRKLHNQELHNFLDSGQTKGVGWKISEGDRHVAGGLILKRITCQLLLRILHIMSG